MCFNSQPIICHGVSEHVTENVILIIVFLGFAGLSKHVCFGAILYD